MSEEMQELIDNNPEWYKHLQYKDVKVFIQSNINNVSMSFVAIGYYLKYVRDNQLYKEDGYTGISEFAKAEFGISPAQASKFISINDRFSKDGNSPILLERYREFSSSKLSEMLYLTDEQLEQVTITTTRAEIRDIVKPAVKEEAFSHAKTEPDCFIRKDIGDGLTCSGGISDRCSSCDKFERGPEKEEVVPTSEQRHDTEKPSGNCIHRSEFPCTLPEASKLAVGDGEGCNAKCCWGCSKHGGCDYECNSSAHRTDEQKVNDDNREAIIPELIKSLFNSHNLYIQRCGCDFGLIDRFKLNASLNASFGFGDDGQHHSMWQAFYKTESIVIKDFSDKRVLEVYYETLVKLMKEQYQETVTTEPEYIESVTETEESVIEEPDEVIPERDCHSCKYDTMDPDEYLTDHPGAKELPCNKCDDKLNHWEPKNNEHNLIRDPDLSCKFDPDARCLIASRKSCKLNSDDQCGYCSGGWSEDDYITAESEAHEIEPVETVEADIIQTVPEMVEISKPKFPSIKGYMDDPYCPECNAALIYKCDCLKCGCKINWEPVRGLFEFDEEQLQKKLAERNQSIPEPIEQPELPILKNNDQRKDFIDAYTTWPIWIDQKETGERYYRYDLNDKASIVVKVSRKHSFQGYKETKDYEYGAEQYYLLGIKSEWHQTGVVFTEDPSRTFYECASNKSALVEYLKYFQKKGA